MHQERAQKWAGLAAGVALRGKRSGFCSPLQWRAIGGRVYTAERESHPVHYIEINVAAVAILPKGSYLKKVSIKYKGLCKDVLCRVV